MVGLRFKSCPRKKREKEDIRSSIIEFSACINGDEDITVQGKAKGTEQSFEHRHITLLPHVTAGCIGKKKKPTYKLILAETMSWKKLENDQKD